MGEYNIKFKPNHYGYCIECKEYRTLNNRNYCNECWDNMKG